MAKKKMDKTEDLGGLLKDYKNNYKYESRPYHKEIPNFGHLLWINNRLESKIEEAVNGGGGGGIIFIERSLPDLHTDISNNDLVPGATYKITGVHKAHTVDSIPIAALYDDGRDLGTTIFLKAISENELESFGSGIFYNPKYDKQVQGFGIWSSDKTYNVDDIVFWGGYAWKNLTGNTGADTDILNLGGDWEKLNYDDVNYNKVVDYIEYDIEKDIITRRYDTVSEIDVNSGFFDIVDLALDFSSISLMQWGNDLYKSVSDGRPPVIVMVGVGNISVKHTSVAQLINFKGEFIYNVTLDNRSYLQGVTFDNGSILRNITLDNGSGLGNATFDNGSILRNITFDNGSRLDSVTFDNGSSLDSVTLDNNSRLSNVTLDNSIIRYNTFISFIADFSYQTYSNLQFSNIKFEGDGGIAYIIPDISNGVILIDPSVPQKKVFGIDSMTQKIQYWDSVSNDFVVTDITD